LSEEGEGVELVLGGEDGEGVVDGDVLWYGEDVPDGGVEGVQLVIAVKIIVSMRNRVMKRFAFFTLGHSL